MMPSAEACQILNNPYIDYALGRVFDFAEDRRYAHLILRLHFPELKQLSKYFMAEYPVCSKKRSVREEALCQQEQD